MAAAHFPPGDDGKTGRKGRYVQAVLVLRADGSSTDMGDFFARGKRQRCFQHEPLQAVAAKVCVDDGAVRIGPVLHLGARHIHEGRIVGDALRPQKRTMRYPPRRLPCHAPMHSRGHRAEMFSTARPARISLGPAWRAHLALPGVPPPGTCLACAARSLRTPAAAPSWPQILCRKISILRFLQNKIILFRCFQYKCRFYKCQFQVIIKYKGVCGAWRGHKGAGAAQAPSPGGAHPLPVNGGTEP